MTGAPRFDWDEANIGHIARPGVAQAEAEQVLTGSCYQIQDEERGGEHRFAELGETERGRLLIVAWTWRRGKVRVVTAFPANRKWRAFYKRMQGRK